VFGRKPARALRVRVNQSSEYALACLAGEFNNMKSVNLAHAADSRDGNLEWFRQRANPFY
jgi:hypothetical protein